MDDLGAFSTAAPVLGLRKSTTRFSYNLLALPDVSPTGFQNQMLEGLPFLVQFPQARVRTLHSSGMTFVVVITLPIVSHCMRNGE